MVMFGAFGATFINAIFIGFTGLTLGKWLFGIKILNDEKRPLGVLRALKREFMVWFSGLGCGLPGISILTVLFSYRRLKAKGITSWDEAIKSTVIQRTEQAALSAPMLIGRIAIAAIFIRQMI